MQDLSTLKLKEQISNTSTVNGFSLRKYARSNNTMNSHFKTRYFSYYRVHYPGILKQAGEATISCCKDVICTKQNKLRTYRRCKSYHEEAWREAV